MAIYNAALMSRDKESRTRNGKKHKMDSPVIQGKIHEKLREDYQVKFLIAGMLLATIAGCIIVARCLVKWIDGQH